MITNISSASPHLYTGTSYPIHNTIYTSLSPGTCEGEMRYDTSMNKVRSWTHGAWKTMDNTATISLDSRITEVIEWATKKMNEERELYILSQDNPAIADLLATIEDAKSKIQVIKTLSK